MTENQGFKIDSILFLSFRILRSICFSSVATRPRTTDEFGADLSMPSCIITGNACQGEKSLGFENRISYESGV
jgi:hypothetical protein